MIEDQVLFHLRRNLEIQFKVYWVFPTDGSWGNSIDYRKATLTSRREATNRDETNTHIFINYKPFIELR